MTQARGLGSFFMCVSELKIKLWRCVHFFLGPLTTVVRGSVCKCVCVLHVCAKLLRKQGKRGTPVSPEVSFVLLLWSTRDAYCTIMFGLNVTTIEKKHFFAGDREQE